MLAKMMQADEGGLGAPPRLYGPNHIPPLAHYGPPPPSFYPPPASSAPYVSEAYPPVPSAVPIDGGGGGGYRVLPAGPYALSPHHDRGIPVYAVPGPAAVYVHVLPQDVVQRSDRTGEIAAFALFVAGCFFLAPAAVNVCCFARHPNPRVRRWAFASGVWLTINLVVAIALLVVNRNRMG